MTASGGNPFRTKPELDALMRVRKAGLADRLPATVWVYENAENGNLVVSDGDVVHTAAAGNVWKYTAEDPDAGVDKKVELASVHKKDAKRFLQQMLMVKHFRVEVFRYNSKAKSFEKVVTSTPCDLGDEMKEMLFEGGDEEESSDQFTQMALRMGPSAAVVVQTDSKELKVGLALWHSASGQCQVAEFYDNPGMDVLESMVVQHSPMECYLLAGASSSPKYRQAKAVLERNRVLLVNSRGGNQTLGGGGSAFKKAELEKTEADILKIIPPDDKHFFESSNGLAIKALSSLVLNNSNMSLAQLKSKVRVLDTQEFILFNSQADAGLNIFDTSESAAGVSLFKILNRTRTSGGERMMRVWLKQPLTNREKIQERLDTVEQLVNSSGARKSLHEAVLRRLPDFESLSLKIKDGRAQLGDLYKCYLGIKEVKNAIEVLSDECSGSDLMSQSFVRPLERKCDDLQKFSECVEATLDFEALNEAGGAGRCMVNPNFDDTLRDLKDKLDKVMEGIDRSLDRLVSSVGLDKKSVKLETSAQHGYCFRVTMKDEKALRGKSGIITVDTTKTGVRFRNNQLETLNKQYQALVADYDSQQEVIVKEIMNVVSTYVVPFSELGGLVSRLDCLVAFAVAAELAPIPYVKPQVGDRGQGHQIVLDQARHPCLETMENVSFIPNDAKFSTDRRFCVITGPNLGGKSTYLRSVALNVLMAQVGSFVACTSAKIFPVDRILVRIGAGDSQLTGVSTFMAEMLEASYIVRSSTEHSLILIDELGRGTSTYDGLGLAWAISRHIASEVRAICLFATHFHEITRLGDELPDAVFNCHVDAIASGTEFTLLYNVKDGSSNKSFGIEVAKLAGFPQEVVDNAQKYLLQAEMPKLRAQGADKAEIAKFLDEWKRDDVSGKRKSELLKDMRAKVAKVL